MPVSLCQEDSGDSLAPNALTVFVASGDVIETGDSNSASSSASIGSA